jgi:hypothetical protein
VIKDYWTYPRVLYTQYLGIVTGDELIQSSLQKSGDSRFDSIDYLIGDWSQVDRTEISAEHVKELIACLNAISRICPKARNASIVKRNDTGLALVAWYRHLGSELPWTIDIFHAIDEAFDNYNLNINMLELPPETIETHPISLKTNITTDTLAS